MTKAQLTRAALYGLAFWFVAAMTVRWLAVLFDGGVLNLLVLLGSIPIAWLSIPVGLRATGVRDGLAIDVNVVALIAATLADGVGLTFFYDRLYAGVSPASQFGAAWILWGVGWILFFAWLRRGRA